jgi:hypothetical protein
MDPFADAIRSIGRTPTALRVARGGRPTGCARDWGSVDPNDHRQIFSAAGDAVAGQQILTAAGHADGFSGDELPEAARLLGTG